MKGTHHRIALLWFLVLLACGCGGNTTVAPTPVTPNAPSTNAEFAYALTGYAVSMYTVNSSTGAFTATMPATVATGYAPPQQGAEQMVADPLGRFAYVANLVANATDPGRQGWYADRRRDHGNDDRGPLDCDHHGPTGKHRVIRRTVPRAPTQRESTGPSRTHQRKNPRQA